MDERTAGALKRILEEVKEYRKAECLMKDCLVNRIIGGNDIDLVEEWLNAGKTCKHIITKAEYFGKKLLGYRCVSCSAIIPVNPVYTKRRNKVESKDIPL